MQVEERLEPVVVVVVELAVVLLVVVEQFVEPVVEIVLGPIVPWVERKTFLLETQQQPQEQLAVVVLAVVSLAIP